MDSLASRVRDSHKTQLALAALAGGAATAALLTTYNNYNRRQKRRDLRRDVLRSVTESTSSSRVTPPPASFEEIQLGNNNGHILNYASYDEDLVREQLARNYAFFGEEGMAKIRGSNVVVVGCGGVGSWAAVMLVRS